MNKLRQLYVHTFSVVTRDRNPVTSSRAKASDSKGWSSGIGCVGYNKGRFSISDLHSKVLW